MPRLFGAIFALFLVQLCHSQQVVSTTFNFDNDNQFTDLSLYGFAQGKTNTYTFTLRARFDNKVHLYLYQNTNNQVNLQVFDGEDATANPIPVANYNPSTEENLTQPKPIVSTGRTMFVRVMADVLYLQNSQDFQAMATDYEQPDGCAPMVYSTNQEEVWTVPLLLTAAPQQCIYVLHANDPLNKQSLSQSIAFNSKKTTFQLYKGLQINDARKLNTDNRAVWAYDKHMIIVPSADTSIQYVWSYADLHIVIHMTSVSNQRGTIMTQDYLQDAYPNSGGPFQQNITMTKASYMSGIGIEFKYLLGTGVIRIDGYINDKVVKTLTYTSGNLPSNMVFPYDRLEIQYSTIDSVNSGFYALYYDPTDYSKVNNDDTTTKSATDYSNVSVPSTTTTSQPIITTTKSATDYSNVSVPSTTTTSQPIITTTKSATDYSNVSVPSTTTTSQPIITTTKSATDYSNVSVPLTTTTSQPIITTTKSATDYSNVPVPSTTTTSQPIITTTKSATDYSNVPVPSTTTTSQPIITTTKSSTDYSNVPVPSTTTTSQPIITTTKSCMVQFNVFSVILSLFSLLQILH